MTDAVSPAENELVSRLFCFGYGYSAAALARLLRDEGWTIAGTCRTVEKRAELLAHGIEAHLFERGQPLAGAVTAGVTHLLVSVPPDAEGDAVLGHHAPLLAENRKLRWLGYLSTTGVYGDTGGALVDETAPLHPTVERSARRAAAERLYLDLHDQHGVPVHVFRLAGIYGPGRNVLDQVRRGEARRIERPGHLFSRIHVDDIAAVLRASIERPDPGRIYNVCDDEPATPAEVTAFACRLLAAPVPPPVSLEEAWPTMSPMARSFWRDNRRVDNGRIKRELGVRLRYPSYREGLAALAASEEVSGAG